MSKEKKTKHPGGRPPIYTAALAEEICNKTASTSKGLKQLCKENKHWPHHSTIYEWLMKYSEFSDLYAKAKRNQVTVLVDEIIEISDNSSHDDAYDNVGNLRPNNEFINRSRLRIDTRKWLAAKLIPRVYGDKITQEHTGGEKPIKTESTVEMISDAKSTLLEKLTKIANTLTDTNDN